MATTVRVPIDLRAPRVSSLAGNAHWTVAALTAWDAGLWQFLKDVDGKAYGVVGVPKNLAVTPNGKIGVALAANATSGVTRWSVKTKAIADAESFNPASLTAETAQDVTVPATAYLRKDVTFPSAGSLGETLAADDLLVVEFFHEGAHANDTLAVNSLLLAAWLQCDIT